LSSFQEGSFFLKCRLRLRLGQDYEQNGVGEKRSRVRLNQFSAGPHSGWAEESANRKSERVQESRDRESAEGSENSVGSWRQRESFGVLNCEGHSEFNLHSAVSSCVAVSACVAMPHCVGMSLYGASLLVLAALLQGAFSQTETETHVHGGKVRQRIASRDGRASSVGAHCAASGSPCLREMGRMVRALWEIGCKENSDYHQVVGDRASCRGPVCQVRVVESQVRVIERAEKRSTPHG